MLGVPDEDIRMKRHMKSQIQTKGDGVSKDRKGGR